VLFTFAMARGRIGTTLDTPTPLVLTCEAASEAANSRVSVEFNHTRVTYDLSLPFVRRSLRSAAALDFLLRPKCFTGCGRGPKVAKSAGLFIYVDSKGNKWESLAICPTEIDRFDDNFNVVSKVNTNASLSGRLRRDWSDLNSPPSPRNWQRL